MQPGAATIISEHDFLEPAECDALIAILERNRHLGLDRNPAMPGTFVTFGRAAYLDVCRTGVDPSTDYFGAIAQSNRSLREILGSFYERLRAMLQSLFGEPVTYEPERLALPGVHVFRGQGIRSAGEAGSHFDVQYQKLPMPGPLDPQAPPISVTIPLRNPVNGTGLQVYDVTYSDYERAYRLGRISKLEELVKRRTSAYYPYTVGRAVLHRGLVVHQLTSPGPIADDDERITLQGHGVRCGGRWILYW
jgi:hypothetical protein